MKPWWKRMEELDMVGPLPPQVKPVKVLVEEGEQLALKAYCGAVARVVMAELMFLYGSPWIGARNQIELLIEGIRRDLDAKEAAA